MTDAGVSGRHCRSGLRRKSLTSRQRQRIHHAVRRWEREGEEDIVKIPQHDWRACLPVPRMNCPIIIIAVTDGGYVRPATYADLMKAAPSDSLPSTRRRSFFIVILMAWQAEPFRAIFQPSLAVDFAGIAALHDFLKSTEAFETMQPLNASARKIHRSQFPEI